MTFPVKAGMASLPSSSPEVSGPRGARSLAENREVDPEMLRAAQGMEAMFLDYMFKVMRQTVPKGDLDLESPATEIYRSMLDTEIADRASHTGGIGLADQIVAYLDSSRYNQNRKPTVPRSSYRKKTTAIASGISEGNSSEPNSGTVSEIVNSTGGTNESHESE